MVSTTRQYLRGWLGLLSAVLLVAAFVGIMTASLDWPGILSSLGLLPAFGLVWGQAWRRTIAVVDADGIRRVGIDNWLVKWSRIESAQIIDGTLVVRPQTGKDEPESALVQDSFQVDDKPSRRRMGVALGQLRETMEADPGLRTVPIAKADQTRIQDAIDHYLGKGGYRAPAAVTSAAEPSAAQWPVWEKSEADDPVDLHEAEIEER